MNSHRTAIKRGKPSSPCKWLDEHEYLPHNVNRILDFGCGRCDDMESLGCDGYDPHYQPIEPCRTYSIVLATYVFNTLWYDDIPKVWESMESFMAPNSVAYVTMRNLKVHEVGQTSKGTFQNDYIFDAPVIHNTGWYRIHKCERKHNERINYERP